MSSVTLAEPSFSPSSHSTQTVLQSPPSMAVRQSLDEALLHLVKNDPFASIGELAADLTQSGQFDGVGWWQLFFILRRNGLLKKRSRFNFARGRR